jgi:hypothetical protein
MRKVIFKGGPLDGATWQIELPQDHALLGLQAESLYVASSGEAAIAVACYAMLPDNDQSDVMEFVEDTEDE